MKPKVSAIVVTYNRLSGLKEILKLLINQSFNLNKIVVVNNNSTDGTKKYLSKINDNNLIVKNMIRNVGGSGGFSMGLRIAFENTDSTLFWLMDDDARPKRDALKCLVKGANYLNNKFGFLCSNIRWGHNYPAPPVADKNWSELLPSNLVRVYEAPFVSFMVSRDTVGKLGLPIRQMFIWGDDVEYSLRLGNYQHCYFVSNSIVYHHNNLSADTKPSSKNMFFNMPASRDAYLGYAFRNELYAYRKNSTTKGLIKKILKDWAFIVRIPFCSKKRRLRKLYYTISGFIKGIFFNPKIEFPKRNYLGNKYIDRSK